MILNKIFYTIIGWLNFPDKSTPLNQKNLRYMDNGILQCAQHILALSQDKLEKSDAAKFITGWTIDTHTWVVTVTHKDGTVESYDFPIEMLPTRLDLDAENNLVLVQQDGTTKKISFERFVYQFGSTATVSIARDGNHITANVVDGSITLDKLEPSVMSTLRQYMLDAQTAAGESERYYTASKSWAVGGTGSRDGEGEDNSQWYCQQAKEEADRAAQYSQIVAPRFYFNPSDSTLYIKEGAGVSFLVSESRLYWKVD